MDNMRMEIGKVTQVLADNMREAYDGLTFTHSTLVILLNSLNIERLLQGWSD